MSSSKVIFANWRSSWCSSSSNSHTFNTCNDLRSTTQSSSLGLHWSLLAERRKLAVADAQPAEVGHAQSWQQLLLTETLYIIASTLSSYHVSPSPFFVSPSSSPPLLRTSTHRRPSDLLVSVSSALLGPSEESRTNVTSQNNDRALFFFSNKKMSTINATLRPSSKAKMGFLPLLDVQFLAILGWPASLVSMSMGFLDFASHHCVCRGLCGSLVVLAFSPSLHHQLLLPSNSAFLLKRVSKWDQIDATDTMFRFFLCQKNEILPGVQFDGFCAGSWSTGKSAMAEAQRVV